jgi:hypothetical protein
MGVERNVAVVLARVPALAQMARANRKTGVTSFFIELSFLALPQDCF